MFFTSKPEPFVTRTTPCIALYADSVVVVNTLCFIMKSLHKTTSNPTWRAMLRNTDANTGFGN